MTLISRTLLSLLTCALLFAGAYASVAGKLPEQLAAIEAATIDAGDYYLSLDGRPIRYHRKKDVYLDLSSIATARNKRHANPDKLSGRAPATYAALSNGLTRVQNHRWGDLDIVRTTQPTAMRSFAKQAASPAQFAPVFTSSDGSDEYLILPDILARFNSKTDVQSHKQALLDRFGMKIKNQLMFSETNFVLAFKDAINDYSKVFATTRALMDLPYIDWAEPNMLVNLLKTEIPDPNDPLYRDQWGLHNWSQNGELCVADSDEFTRDGTVADIDADDAWALMDGLSLSYTPVIAIIDDGVKLDHPDLPIWTNPNPADPNFGGGTNLCIGDVNGCNFGDYYNYGGDVGRSYNRSGPDIVPADGGTLIPPAPQTARDTHGTQIAGIAAAKRNNSKGIAGSAYNAEILPVRLDFNEATDCVAIVDALSYAARYADVISNSWQLPSASTCASTLDSKISDITDGTFNLGPRVANGTPILFGSGNAAAGWQKISINVPSSGNLQFTLHKDIFDDVPGENAVWIDDIKLPGAAVENLSSNLPSLDWRISDQGTNETANAGAAIYSGCTANPSAEVPVTGAGHHVRGGTGHSIKLSAAGSSCRYLEISNVGAGSLEFWVWVSLETWDSDGFPVGDLFRVYLDDGINKTPIGNDLIERSSTSRDVNTETSIYHNTKSYPALHTEVIAVGASNDGSNAPQMEDRAYFSQYSDGTENTGDSNIYNDGKIDILAPGTAIRTTTKNGGYGYLSGTSASTPMVAGVIANMLAVDPSMNLTTIKTKLHDSADKIGPALGEFAYSGGFNQYYGYGRVNSYKAVQRANNVTVGNLAEAPELCTDPNPGAADDDFLLLTLPAIISAAIKNKP